MRLVSNVYTNKGILCIDVKCVSFLRAVLKKNDAELSFLFSKKQAYSFEALETYNFINIVFIFVALYFYDYLLIKIND